MQISKEHQTGYNLSEFRILSQRIIEILDDLDLEKNPLRNKTLNPLLKGLIGPLDKQTKQYNDFHAVCEEGTTHFYNVVKENARFTMSPHLLDKVAITRHLLAYEINPKAIDGIIDKILK